MIQTKELKEFIDELIYASEKANEILLEFKNMKELELDISTTVKRLNESSKLLEKRLATVIAKNVAKEIKPLLEDSYEIKKSAEAIRYAFLKMKELEFKKCNKFLFFLIGILVGASIVFVVMFWKNMY